MIPKIIHYCWFGTNPQSELENKCLESWKRHLPDYEIKLWNETKFNVDFCSFTTEAYNLKKYAFVSDVCRLYALHEEGGIYLDTDMLLLKSLDQFLYNELFLAEERKGLISAGIIGATMGNLQIKKLLEGYKKQEFNYQNPLDIPKYLTRSLKEIKNGVEFYPSEYFYPLPFAKKGTDYSQYLTENSYAVHLWNHSWKNEWAYLHDKAFGKSIKVYLERLTKKPFSLFQDFFLLDFLKYLLADKLGFLYRHYKKILNN